VTYGKTITIEDLEIQIPQTESQGTKSKFHKSIRGGRLPYFVEKTSNYSWTFCSKELLIKFEEMASNPFFSPIPIYNLSDRINHGFIKSWSRNWQFSADVVSLSLIKGYGKFMFLPETIERPIHDRWNYLIQEDFDASGIWASNANVPASPFNSTGYGRQAQTIPFEVIAGDWETHDEGSSGIAPLVGDQTLRNNQDVSSRIIAGWDWWSDYEVSSWVRIEDVDTDNIGIIGRFADINNYFLFFTTDSTGVLLSQYKDGSVTQWTDSTFNIEIETWYQFKLVFEGRRVKAYIDGKEIFDILTEDNTSGRAGLYSRYNNSYFDDFRVTSTFPKNYNLPASVDWFDNYFHAEVPTAHGTQKKLISVDQSIHFKQSKAGSDCILYLPLNEGEGDPIDHSKNKNAVTRVGGTWALDKEKGWVLEWSDVDGERVYVDLPNDSPTKYTIDFEVRADVFQYGYAVHFEGFHPLWYIGGTPSAWSWYWNGVRYDNAEANMSINTWYRISIVADSDNDWAECFVDGELIGRVAQVGVGPLGDDYVGIGNSYTDGDNKGWTGAIKELKVYDTLRWDVALGFAHTPATVFVWDDNRYDSDVDYPDDSECELLLHCDEGSGTTLYDASSNSRDSSSWVGTPSWGETSFRGDAGTCFDCDTGDYAWIPHAADFHSNHFTIETWVRPDNLPAAGTYGMFVNKTTAYILRCQESGGATYIYGFVYDGVDYEPNVKSTTEIQADRWYHVALVYDGDLKLYIDGVLEDTEVARTYAPAGTANMAYGSITGTATITYQVDELRYHSRALSANEIAARYRSEPYLHDYYLMDRVYSKIHKFKGLPLISNGLIKLAFPDYDTYEYRGANVLMPTVYAWYENSWHELGFICPYVQYSSETKTLNNMDYCEWEIEELTDQYCKMRITYIDVGDYPQWPEDYKVEMRFIIRNGYPGVIVEPIGNYQDDEASDRHGFLFQKRNVLGQGLQSRYVFMPKDNFYDSEDDTHIGLASSAVDDNWFIKFDDYADLDAPMLNVIVGGFSDSMLDDYGAGTQWYVGDTDGYYIYYLHQTTYGGIFFLPYDHNDLFKEANSDDADVTTNGQNNQGCGSTGLGCILIGNGTPSEYAQWNIGTLPKGSYLFVVSVKSYNGSINDREFIMQVDNDSDHDGDIAASGTLQIVVPTAFEHFSLPFYTDGEQDIYLNVENVDATDDIYVDNFICIPISNSVNYPADLAHQAFNETKPIRGLKK